MQLITYKVITLGQHGKMTGEQPGSLDSAHGSSGHTPQVAGEPPAPPPEDDHAVFEGIQVSPCTKIVILIFVAFAACGTHQEA